MLSALATSAAPVHLVVTVSGELDMTSVPALSRELAVVLRGRPASVTLDLAGVAFIDSSGLNLLIGTSKALRKHQATLWLSSPRPPVRRLLEIVGLEPMLVV